MTRLTVTLALLVPLFSVACGNKVDDKIDELAAKPTASTISDAKALYDEVADLVRWLEAKKEPSSPEQLAAAKALRQQRVEEMVELGKDKITTGVSDFLSGLGIDVSTIDVGKAKDWLLGVDNPEVDKFKGLDRAPTDKEGAKGWP